MFKHVLNMIFLHLCTYKTNKIIFKQFLYINELKLNY